MMNSGHLNGGSSRFNAEEQQHASRYLICDQGKFQLSIGRSGETVPMPFKIEAANAFEETNEIFTVVRGWIFTKSNPELVASLREYPRRTKR